MFFYPNFINPDNPVNLIKIKVQDKKLSMKN